jgi:hypothetical protein
MRFIEFLRDILEALYGIFEIVVLAPLRPLFGQRSFPDLLDDTPFPGDWSYIDTLPKPVLILQQCWPLFPMMFVGRGTTDRQELKKVDAAIEWLSMSRRVKSECKQCAQIEAWLKAGGDVNARTLAREDVGHFVEFSPLMAAVYLNQERVVRFLLQHGADVHVSYASFYAGDTLLSVARKHASYTIQRMLIQAGATE